MSTPALHFFVPCPSMRADERHALYRAAVTCQQCIDGMRVRGLMPLSWKGGAA